MEIIHWHSHIQSLSLRAFWLHWRKSISIRTNNGNNDLRLFRTVYFLFSKKRFCVCIITVIDAEAHLPWLSNESSELPSIYLNFSWMKIWKVCFAVQFVLGFVRVLSSKIMYWQLHSHSFWRWIRARMEPSKNDDGKMIATRKWFGFCLRAHKL